MGIVVWVVQWVASLIFLLIYCSTESCTEMGCLACAILFSFPKNLSLISLMLFISTILVYFGIGAIIGLIVSKIRRKK